jgi:regulator of nonsense transcripts 1
MEGAFTHMGNHLVSDSAATINAGDVDEGILDSDLARGGLSRRRRDDDEEYDEDDLESMASMPVGTSNGQSIMRAEDAEVELPTHACT